MSDYPMLISNKLHSFRNFCLQRYKILCYIKRKGEEKSPPSSKTMSQTFKSFSASA